MKSNRIGAIGVSSAVLTMLFFSGDFSSRAVAWQPESKGTSSLQAEGTPRGHFPASLEIESRPPPRRDGKGRRGHSPDSPPPHRARRGDKKMSKEERIELREFVKEHFPKMHEELQRLRDRNPERARKRMRHMAPGFLQMMRKMESDPEQGSLMIRERRLDMRLRRSGRQYRGATDDGRRDKLETAIRKLCAEAFDCRQALREMGIRELEARVAELRDRHREATSMRGQLIERAVRDHLEGPPGRGKGRPGRQKPQLGKP